MFPSFKENSFLELSFESIILYDFSIEIEFKFTKSNGLIFYASELIDGLGDFISLILRNNLIEMRYKIKKI
jgi:hypothetical protein